LFGHFALSELFLARFTFLQNYRDLTNANALIFNSITDFNPSTATNPLNNSTPITGTWSDAYFGYTGDSWSGYLVGIVLGNTNTGAPGEEDAFVAAVQEYLGYALTDYTVETISNGSGTSGTFTSTKVDSHNGTWAFDPPNSGALGFYAVKGAQEFTLYFVDPAQSSGIWSTANLINNGGNEPAISHLTIMPTTAAPVPEPATLLLLGSGLLGAAGFRKKIKK